MINGSKKNTGFIALHRTIQEHWIWDDPVKLKWWLDILMSVNHTNAKVNIGFELMACKRGQSLNSLQTWAKRWRIDVSTVRRFFDLLKKDGMITIENIKVSTRLTVCNYDSYNKTKHESPSTDNGETTQRQSRPNTNNNDFNNENNEREMPSPFSEEENDLFLSSQAWIQANAPSIAKMKSPLSIKEFFAFQKSFPGPKGHALFKLVLTAMNNWTGISKKRSAYLTMLNWIKNEKYDEQVISLRESFLRPVVKLNEGVESANWKKLREVYGLPQQTQPKLMKL